jgi:hypothetical protein
MCGPWGGLMLVQDIRHSVAECERSDLNERVSVVAREILRLGFARDDPPQRTVELHYSHTICMDRLLAATGKTAMDSGRR